MHDLSIAVLGKTSVFLYGCRNTSLKIASKPEVYFMQQQNERDFKNYCPEKSKLRKIVSSKKNTFLYGDISYWPST